MGVKRILLARLGMLLLLVSGAPQADIVSDLHSAQVPVAEQSSRALATGAGRALAQVLVKVSGSFELLENSAVQDQLKNARGQVQQYAYLRDANGIEGLSARFEFDSGYITQLVASAGAPLWTANRPLVLAWVVLESPEGRQFVSWEATPERAQALTLAFSRRGVPVQLPLFDLADTAVSVDDVWLRDATIMQAASARYDVENIAVGRMTLLSNDALIGDWTYFYLDERSDRAVNASNTEGFMEEGVGLVAQKMAARYAVAATGESAGNVRMSVAGVYSYADYAGIVNWLQSLELIEYANVERIFQDRIDLRLQANADAAQLAAIIELNSRLQRVENGQFPTQLSYQWLN
ncbi:MAG: hypothetical protein ACI9JM_000263 [Halioglobus sp.]|jgi:hypothetical protein